MLQSDEVDDDFFTPKAGTSLASIFGNTPKINDGKSNDSLKYTPPKPQNIPPKPEQTKTTECIFACALIGHEWFNNVYTPRGKLGFAIVKIQNTGEHNIILYDSTKTTLSCATISTKLEVTIKNNTYISYYDNLTKYWSIYGKEEDVKKVADQLTSLDVDIKYSNQNTDQGAPEPINADINTNYTVRKSDIVDKGSDTDSSVNKKTKASILNRMANMGHSVLPTRTLSAERTSDSSDTPEINIQPKPVRHKPVKNIIKRNYVENIPDSQQLSESHQKIIVTKPELVANTPAYTSHTGQILPITTTNFITSPNSDLTVFMSEQRISNSELRINMNRITDKVDSVLDKINNFEFKGPNVHTDILMKLLTEYENKIKVYEELMKSRGDINMSKKLLASSVSNDDNQIEILINKISELERMNQEKSNEVLNLQKEIKSLKLKHADEKLEQENKEDELLKKIKSLENNAKTKDEEFTKILKKCENLSCNTNDYNIGERVKTIMNDTFQTISLHFDNNEDYSGEAVKKVIAAVIKKITIQTLSEL